jgi:ABC-type branched-subunit amino acid transport system substrate-binding protein
MSFLTSTIRRRILLRGTSFAALCAVATSTWAQPGKASSARGVTVAQIVDFSQTQQDVSKDFLNGSRAAWQEINLRGGIRGRQVQHLTVQSDSSESSLRAALDSIKANTSCVVMSGNVGDHVASKVLEITRQEPVGIADAAPWLQNSSLEIDESTFPIFAARQEQIGHALKTLSVMGMSEIGAIYASPQDYTAYQLEIKRIASSLQFKLQSFQGNGDLRLLGQKLTAQTPAVLLFVGGTPELAAFTQGLEKQSRQRYIVALADVNLQTMLQMGAAPNTPVIATQPVPMVNASLPVVRSYREALSRLFDEPPTSLSLAGYIAARYTFEVLNEIDGPINRQNVLAAFQKRSKLDLGGFLISFGQQRRSSNYVTQSMLTTNGRLIG